MASLGTEAAKEIQSGAEMQEDKVEIDRGVVEVEKDLFKGNMEEIEIEPHLEDREGEIEEVEKIWP